jgi:hypothetical protein
MGTVFLYLLVATIGASAQFRELAKNLPNLAVGVLWMAIHAGSMLAVRRFLRAPIFFLAVGSQANVGGAASASVVAAAFHPALAPVGVLLAVLGYVLGTYVGLLMAFVFFVWRMGQLFRAETVDGPPGVHAVRLHGALFFGAVGHVEDLALALPPSEPGLLGSSLPLAVVLHRVPVSLVIWWLLRPRLGVWPAALALSVEGLGTIVGYALAQQLAPHVENPVLNAVQALVAGSLLHVVVDRRDFGRPHVH